MSLHVKLSRLEREEEGTLRLIRHHHDEYKKILLEKIRIKERIFQLKYKTSSEEVRSSYIELLESHSYQGGDGYKVDVPGYNENKIHHFILRPDKREVCLPTQQITEAFAIFDQKVHISDQLHVERWGN